ncbi:hypothetical protein [Cohnella cellulosilytica]|uniref:Uncharacterized protein n=1 Tax=Cohnella cellulosilytica TaxID=986710 RepID=A0ABW2FI65_9BACL
MTFTISENKKKAIIAFINDHFNKRMSHFPFAKYPTESLDRWREHFAEPKAIGPETLRAALSWRGGFWQRKDAPYAQRQNALSIIKLWPEFAREDATEPARAFGFWTERLPNCPLAFDTAAFLAHLIRPDALELGGHAQAGGDAGPAQGSGAPGRRVRRRLLPGRAAAVHRLLPAKMQSKHGDRARVQLDRFQKAYGNRHALVKLAGKVPPTVEPTVRTLDWEALACKHFAPQQIAGRANADVLFACLLLALDGQQERDVLCSDDGRHG